MKKQCFNEGWTFTNLLRQSEPVNVTLPHDAMRTEKRINGLKNGEATGYFPGGKYVYEKDYLADENQVKETCFLEFEGIYQKSEIYLNDKKVGGRVYGYSDFLVDLTGNLKVGCNHIKVLVDNTQTPNSRWYSGSGIYRDVFLHTAADSYIPPYGIRLNTMSIAPAVVSIDSDVVLEPGMELITTFYFHDNKVAEFSGTKGQVAIPDAQLWSTTQANLYDVYSYLVKDQVVIDETVNRIGIRQIDFSHNHGFQLNGDVVQ